MELVNNFNSMSEFLFLRFLLFLFLFGLLFGSLFVCFAFFRLEDLSTAFYFLLPFFSETELTILLVSCIFKFLESIWPKSLAIVNKTLAEVNKLVVGISVNISFTFFFKFFLASFFTSFAFLILSFSLFLSFLILFLFLLSSFLSLLFLFLF